MPRPVDGDGGGRMEIEIYLPLQSISPALWAGLLTLCIAILKKFNLNWNFTRRGVYLEYVSLSFITYRRAHITNLPSNFNLNFNHNLDLFSSIRRRISHQKRKNYCTDLRASCLLPVPYHAWITGQRINGVPEIWCNYRGLYKTSQAGDNCATMSLLSRW